MLHQIYLYLSQEMKMLLLTWIVVKTTTQPNQTKQPTNQRKLGFTQLLVFTTYHHHPPDKKIKAWHKIFTTSVWPCPPPPRACQSCAWGCCSCWRARSAGPGVPTLSYIFVLPHIPDFLLLELKIIFILFFDFLKISFLACYTRYFIYDISFWAFFRESI